MSSKYRKDVSVRLTNFLLHTAGFWFAANRVEDWFRKAATLYTAFTVLFVMWLQLRGLYFSWGDFDVCVYMICNSLGLVLDLLKIAVVFVHKKKFLGLIVHLQKNFLHFNYDRYENSIFEDTKRISVYFICIVSFFSESTVFSYIAKPLLANIGRNESDREHIYNMWLDIPVSVTPYYEIIYIIQALSVFQVAVCYLCFDNIFCIICLHVASQFRILQYRIANIPSPSRTEESNEDASTCELYTTEECYAKFKSCIQQHQALIEFCATLDEVFTVIVLGQVLMFSILICFLGYRVFLAKLTFASRVGIASYFMTSISQLWIFTYSCDCVTKESMNVAEAVYTGPWINLPMDKYGKMIRKDLQMVVLRARRACSLTAWGYFSISCETYTKIMSTAMSYFTLLKQSTEDVATK